MNSNTLSPADKGILAAVLDDALAAGQGDDDTVAALSGAILFERMAATESDAQSIAYDFFRASRH